MFLTQIWDFGSSQLLETVPFPSATQGEFLYVGRFCGSGDLIAAGGSGTNDLKIINRKTRGVSFTLPHTHPTDNIGCYVIELGNQS